MNKIIVNNRKAYYEYHVLETLTTGIKLLGPEIKPIKNNNVSLNESYCFILDGELFIKGLYVPQNTQNSILFDSNRNKKLLAKKKEIERLEQKVGEKGLTIIPLQIILTENCLIKIVIGLCKGKNLRDKRLSIKEKDIQKDLKKNFGL
jgi:SsrA-binding protein